MRDDEAYLMLLTRSSSPHRIHREFTAATIRLDVAAIRGLYSTFHWAHVSAHLFMHAMRLPIGPTPGIDKVPPYSHRDIEAMLGLCDPLERALVLIFAHVGLRVGETLPRTPQNLDLTAPSLTIIGKWSRMRSVPLSARTRDAFACPTPTTPIFPWTYQQATTRLLSISREADVRWRGFHPFREYAGTRLYHQTHDYTRVATCLGQISTDTTRRYVAAHPDDAASEVESW